MSQASKQDSKQDSKIVLITGGSRGLGKSAALHLAERGHDFIITWQHQEGAAQDVVAQIKKAGRRAVALQLDMGNSAGFPAFADSVPRTWMRTGSAKTWTRWSITPAA